MIASAWEQWAAFLVIPAWGLFLVLAIIVSELAAAYGYLAWRKLKKLLKKVSPDWFVVIVPGTVILGILAAYPYL